MCSNQYFSMLEQYVHELNEKVSNQIQEESQLQVISLTPKVPFTWPVPTEQSSYINMDINLNKSE